MKRVLIGFALGAVFGVLLVLGPGPVVDSPWPAPTPSPTPLLDWAEEIRKADKALCDAAMKEAILEERVRLTCQTNPDPCPGPGLRP